MFTFLLTYFKSRCNHERFFQLRYHRIWWSVINRGRHWSNHHCDS
nr:MAG TPA: nonstructural protein [Caudoviricetes sp.]